MSKGMVSVVEVTNSEKPMKAKHVPTAEFLDTFGLTQVVESTWRRHDGANTNPLETTEFSAELLKSAVRIALADAFEAKDAKVDINVVSGKSVAYAAAEYKAADTLTMVPLGFNILILDSAPPNSCVVLGECAKGKYACVKAPSLGQTNAIVPFWDVETTKGSADANVVAGVMVVPRKGFGKKDMMRIPVLETRGALKTGTKRLVSASTKASFSKLPARGKSSAGPPADGPAAKRQKRN